MNIVDVSLLVALGGFILYGFWFGIIHMVGSLLGVLVGAIAAGRLYVPAAHWIAPYVGGNDNLAKVIGFFVIFVLVNKLVGLAFWVVEKIFKFISVIPFLKTFNRLLGAALGLLEGTLVLGLAVYFASRFPIGAEFDALLGASSIAHALLPVGSILAPLLPLAVRAAQSFM
ncbi:MAG: hypothetical protein RL272_1293 [Candidatus Parcubacteria bacterium]